MTKKNVVWLGDWLLGKDGTPLTGYGNISAAFCSQLATDSNISLIALGFAYQKNEYNYPFGITKVPLGAIGTSLVSINQAWKIDHLFVCLDIPIQRQIVKQVKGSWKYNGIFAVESSPLYMPWAMDLAIMDHCFTISEFGKQEAMKAGVMAEHLIAPVDRGIWTPRTLEEQKAIKETLGVQDKTVLFINAAGNERKNTAIVFEVLKDLKLYHNRTDFHLYVLTNVDSPAGWDLKELANRFGINKQITLLDKGLTSQEVRNLYAAADFLINTSKAEGMGYPILEAMSVGTPTIVTDATAMRDHAAGGKRAIALKADYQAIDVFGNTDRFYVFPETLKKALLDGDAKLKADPHAFDQMVADAQAYIEERNNSNAIELLRKVINE